MSANQASFPIAAMARVLGVSKAGYYAWLQRPPSAHATADAALLKRIKTVHASSRQTYGAPRVHADLRGRGERHSRKRIARLMREAGLVGASHRHGGPTTTRRNKDDRPAPDLVDRDFSATRPNQLWVADITYVPTMAGFLYLAVVLDAWSRKIVGWAMANHLGGAARAFGVTDAALAHDRSVIVRGVAGEQVSSHVHRFAQLEIGGEIVNHPEFVVTNVKLSDADVLWITANLSVTPDLEHIPLREPLQKLSHNRV
jgi:hypothetical protein